MQIDLAALIIQIYRQCLEPIFEIRNDLIRCFLSCFQV